MILTTTEVTSGYKYIVAVRLPPIHEEVILIVNKYISQLQ